jgi:serine/threonine protein kinase/tetratricopeptide (TPR) repeat protein
VTNTTAERIERLFHGAVDLPEGERARYLDESCGGDADLRARVEELLRHDARSAGFLERPVAAKAGAAGKAGAAATDAAPGGLVPGTRLGPWTIRATLGSGGMGTVYLADGADGDRSRAVALKVLHAELSDKSGYFVRFQREAQAGMRVADEHVVRTLDFGTQMAGGRSVCYLVMEHVEGRTLRALLRELGTVPEALVREIGRQVATGLAAIHAAGVVHRDVKPENVLITRDEQVRIMDLGVAKILDATHALTCEGHFAGSLAYAAPEQFRGGAVGPGADLYALGVVLYELASGTSPFARETTAAMVRAHLDERVADLTEIAPDLSPFLSEVVASLLEKDAARRPSSAVALLEILDGAERSAWWADRHEERRRRKSSIPRVPVRRETALHGREDDLALLAELWTKAKAGKGATVLLEGEAGIGKSRLVDAFLQTLGTGGGGEDAHVLYGSYAPAGGLGGLSAAVLQRFDMARLDTAIRPYLTATPGLVPAFAALLRNEAPPEGALSLAGDALHGVFVHLMRGLAAEKPLVWVVEDLHFAAEDVRKIAISLARAVEGHRVMLVLTSRPPVAERDLASLGRTGTFRRAALGRLGAREVIQLLRDAFKNERLVEKLGVPIAEKSDGVPFYVFEMIRGLKEGQFVAQLADGTWVESKVIDRIEVPSAVKDLIGVRLGDLTQEQREVLDVGAVQGYEFDPDLAADALERRPLAVLQTLAHVERRWGVVRPSGHGYRFDHHQIQEVVYADLAQRLREEYHAAVADALERRAGAAEKEVKSLDGALCVDLAEHLLQGNRGTRALRYMNAALTHLEKGFVNIRAVALAERALAAPGLLAGSERGNLLLRMAKRLDLLGQREPQRAAIEEALALARATGDSQGEGSASGNLGTMYWTRCDFSEAREHHERHLALARKIGDRAGEASATGGLGLVLQSLGRHAEARDHHERALAIHRELGDRRGEAIATGNLGIILSNLGRLAEAREHDERHLALAREIGDRRSEANATGSLGNVFYGLGRYAEARDCQERCLALAREIGDRRSEALTSGNLGGVCHTLGRFAEARNHFDRHLALAREIGDRASEARATGNLGAALSTLGRLAEAREHYERHLALAREINDRQGEALAAVNLGCVFSTLGRLGEAREHLDRSLTLAREMGNRSLEGSALGCLAGAASESGDIALARRLLATALDVRRSMGAQGEVAESLLARGALFDPEGRADEARADLQAALAIARDLALPGVELAACAHLALLPGGDVAAALAELAAHEGRVAVQTAMEARFLLWQATHDPAHLAEAKRLLDFFVEHAPPESRATMLANVYLHREIAAAAKEAGL